jgi:hypothetical protein
MVPALHYTRLRNNGDELRHDFLDPRSVVKVIGKQSDIKPVCNSELWRLVRIPL